MDLDPSPADVIQWRGRTGAARRRACAPTTTPVPPTCSDVCSLADAICDNAEAICGIADELGKDDHVAQEKCTSAKASCREAKQRCCNCSGPELPVGGTAAAGGRAVRAALGLALGALCAAVIACGGGAMKSAAPPGVAPGVASEAAGVPPSPGPARGELDELVRKIDTDLAAMGLSPPAVPPSACIRPPCGADALSVTAVPQHTDDPSCKPGPSDACHDSCRLSDSICDSSGRICKIAVDLGGDDAYANEKCASGKASCDAARGRCCGCQL